MFKVARGFFRTDSVLKTPHAPGTLLPVTRRLFPSLAMGLALLFCARAAPAHPTPFSYLDLRLHENGVTGSLVVHVYDAAYELEVSSPESLLGPQTARDRADLVGLLVPRLTLLVDGRAAHVQWGDIDLVPGRQSLRLSFTVPGGRPARLQVQALLFPYDPAHQTFLNIYEDDALKSQAILDVRRDRADYYSGTAQGRWAVVRTFVLSGIEHILIGPDHVLFLVGLLLLGGSIGRLALIVTAFTIGHSLTLSLAVLNIFSPSARLVEPLIALTIIVVGADNLLVLRASRAKGPKAKDIRAWLAAAFGLIHGFGFASVLKEFGLPPAALGFSLFAFNLGVEIGQLFIVGVVTGSLILLRRRRPTWGDPVARAGSIAVILAGLYWFLERTFFSGGLL